MPEPSAVPAPRRRLWRLALPLLALAIPLLMLAVRYGPVSYDLFVDDQSCAGCHRGINEAMVMQWLGSAHFSADVGCEACHGTDHDAMFAADGAVSSKVCAGCHQAAYDEFSRSGHVLTAAKARKNGRFLAIPPAMQRQGCMTCHDIGREYPDGGKGSCNYCHTGHRFSKAEAREPRACEVCHMGPDHPQMEAWRASKHGVVYTSLHDEETAPTCVTCHLGGEAGHDSSQTLTLGHISAGAALEGAPPAVPMRIISRDTFEQNRARMIKICRDCHSAGFAERALDDADEIKRISDALVGEAAQIVRDLHDEGLLEPMPKDRPPHPVAGHTLVLGGGQLYNDTSAIEQRFFIMAKFHHSTTFKGAYHNSPDHTHWLGYQELQSDLTFIRAEARRLRTLASIKAKLDAVQPPQEASPTPRTTP